MAAADPDRLRRLLAELENHLRRQQAPIVDAWRPGLAPGEASAIAEVELGWRLPVEVEVWFEWHNGVERVGPGYGYEYWLTGTDLLLLSLEEAIEQHTRMRRLAEELERDDPVFTADERWSPRWLPLFRQKSADLVFVDCGVPHADASPVHEYAAHDLPRYSQEPKTRSLADAVSIWVAVLERGLSYYDPEQRRWVRRWDEFDEGLRLSGLV